MYSDSRKMKRTAGDVRDVQARCSSVEHDGNGLISMGRGVRRNFFFMTLPSENASSGRIVLVASGKPSSGLASYCDPASHVGARPR